jgi:hypothetical protein
MIYYHLYGNKDRKVHLTLGRGPMVCMAWVGSYRVMRVLR